MTIPLLMLNGNQTVLIKITYQNKLTGYGFFVETRNRLGMTYEKECQVLVSQIEEMIKEDKENIIHILETNPHQMGDKLRGYVYESNEKLYETYKTRLHHVNAGFYGECLSAEAFENLMHKKEVVFSQCIEIKF